MILKKIKIKQMKKENEKMVCADCGSEKINEERLVSRGMDDNCVYDEPLCGYFCRKCEEPVDIVSETAFIEECQIGMREFLKAMPDIEFTEECQIAMIEFLKAMPDIEFIEVNGKIVPTIKQSN